MTTTRATTIKAEEIAILTTALDHACEAIAVIAGGSPEEIHTHLVELGRRRVAQLSPYQIRQLAVEFFARAKEPELPKVDTHLIEQQRTA